MALIIGTSAPKMNEYKLGAVDIATSSVIGGSITFTPEMLEGFSSLTITKDYGNTSLVNITCVKAVDGTSAPTTVGTITVGTPFTLPTLNSGEVLIISMRIDGQSSNWKNVHKKFLCIM